MLRSNDPAQSDHVQSLENDENRRRSLGIYYTPRSAAAILARWALRSPRDTLLEPSFGGCTILEAAVNRLQALGSRVPASQIYGFDVDPSSFTFLRRLIGSCPKNRFHLRDFLKVDARQLRVSAVIGNPPFVSYHRMDSEQRRTVEAWRKTHSPTFPMTASSWAYFLIHSLSFLKPAGRLAFVLPLAATSSDYSRPIMDVLRRHFANIVSCQVYQQLFIQAGAQERTVILLCDGFAPPRGRPCAFRQHSVSTLAELDRVLAIDTDSAASSPTPDCPMAAGVAGGTLQTLGSIFDVTIGEVVGDIPFFVKTREEWEDLRIPPRHTCALITKSRQTPGLRVTSKEVNALYSAVPWLLSPPKSRLPKAIVAYLRKYRISQRSQNSTFAKRQPWYQVTYDSSAMAFIASMSHESPRIIWNEAGISCANSLYKLAPRAGASWKPWMAAASLSSVFRLSAERQARVRGSGALKLEPSDVVRLLLPTNPMTPANFNGRAFFEKLDRLVRAKEFESATREADDKLFLAPGILTPKQLFRIRNELQDLRGRRIAPAD